MKMHPRLEKAIRNWAKECHSNEVETVFEATDVDYIDLAVNVPRMLSEISPFWICIRSVRNQGLDLLLPSEISTMLSDSFSDGAMISFVDPSTGGGVTIDVSEEIGGLVFQAAGWGACSEFVLDLAKGLPQVFWISPRDAKPYPDPDTLGTHYEG